MINVKIRKLRILDLCLPGATHTFYIHKGGQHLVIYIHNLEQQSPITVCQFATHFTDPRKDDSLCQARGVEPGPLIGVRGECVTSQPPALTWHVCVPPSTACFLIITWLTFV